MSTGETAREQSPQKVSSTFLLKLALSCVCNSIFKPAACQSHCAVLPAHASGFGAQCRGRGAGGSLGHRQDAQRMGRGHCSPTPACAELHGGACMSVWHMRVTPRQCVRLPAIVLASGDKTPAGQTDANTITDAGTCRRDGAGRWKE